MTKKKLTFGKIIWVRVAPKIKEKAVFLGYITDDWDPKLKRAQIVYAKCNHEVVTVDLVAITLC